MVTLREVPEVDSGSTSERRVPADPNDPGLDIVDPIGQPPEVFDAVADDIEAAVDRLTAWIIRHPASARVIPGEP